ncbi:SpoIID/LytB domain-containing protein [Nocardia sp. NPDC057030]|uniref:SpoIID/LytB domain-containing protein n=1 Tax=unclassified Nocardia TaxID=2637762 RepID=UPI00362809DA
MRSVLVTGGVTLTVGAVVVLWAWPGDTPYRTVAGPGHGRGMSQLGAFANAQEGWTAERILGHYYPGATLGTVAANTVGIRLTAQDDSTLDTYAGAGLWVAGQFVEAGQAAHLTPLPTGGANVVVTVGCDGEVLWQAATDDPFVYPVNREPNRPAAEHLTLCGGSGYRGALGVATENGAARTVNRVDVEDYLLGVIPAEVQANWADQGGGEALRAQAIAARSYVLAEHRFPYAQSCDTTDCQVYPGTAKEDPRAAAAVVATAGTVLLRDGRILRSEYSSAPGGGEPADIYTFEVGPALSEIAPNAPAAPVDPRTKVAVGESPIEVEYRRIGGAASKVGQPLGPEMALPEHAGTYRMFTNGVIIYTETLGAQVVDFTTLLQLVPDPQAPKRASVPPAPGAVAPVPVPSAGNVPTVSAPALPGASAPPLPESVPSAAGAPPVPESGSPGVNAMPVPEPPAAEIPAAPEPARVPSDVTGAPVAERVPASVSISSPVESFPASTGAAPVPADASGPANLDVAPSSVAELAPSSSGVPVPESVPSGASTPSLARSVPGATPVPSEGGAVVNFDAAADAGTLPVPESISSDPNAPSEAESAPAGVRVVTVFEPGPSEPDEPTNVESMPSDGGVPSVPEPAPTGVSPVPVPESIPSGVSVPTVFESAPPVGFVPPATSVSPGSTVAPTTAATPTPRPTPGIPIPSGRATSSPLPARR